VSYWQTMEGILERIDLLADYVQLGTFNHTVLVHSTAVGATHMQIKGGVGPNTCEWCGLHNGKVYRIGMFMPTLPKHPNCIHWYDILRIGEITLH